MKLTHVVPHIHKEASGPSYSVPRLCQALAELGNDVEISCLAADGDIPGIRLDIHPEWRILRRFAPSPSLAFALHRKAGRVDVVHNHSLWSMVNVAVGWVVPGRGAKLVTSPRGTLSSWALSRSQRVKRLMWPLQRRALERADLLHAASEIEAQDLRQLGFRSPISVIPNGIDLPPARTHMPASSHRTLLFLSRIHPTKGVDHLLGAWRDLEDLHPSWRLIIAGPDELGYANEMQELARNLQLKRVGFPGPVYGVAKRRAYRQAELFILPTHSESFGMVVAEALAHSCPVVVSRGAPWSGVEREGCGWWVANDTESLVTVLHAALSTSTDVLKQMGRRGRAWMRRDFSWSSVAARMDEAYRWLMGQGDLPDSIHFD